MRSHVQDPAETPSLDLIKQLERLATRAGLTTTAHFLRMAMMTETDMNDERQAAAESATRLIERRITEAVRPPAPEPDPVPEPIEEVTTLAQVAEIVRAQFAVVEERLTVMADRITDLERRMYMPPDLVEALKNGSAS